MNNKKPKLENIDDCFKDRFEEFRAVPSSMNWNIISDELENEKLDKVAKHKLERLEVTPEPHIWENVRKKLPLSLYVRNQLNWLSGVAAALTIFMVVMVALDNNNTSTITPITVDTIPTPEVEEVIIVEPEQDFVYNIEPPSKKNKKRSASEALSEEDEKLIANFWDDFFEEDEDLVEAVDNELVEKSLEPILRLPIENLEAALVIPSKEPQQIIIGKSDQNILETILHEQISKK